MARLASEHLIPGSSVVEQPAVNRLVAGSNPARGANRNRQVFEIICISDLAVFLFSAPEFLPRIWPLPRAPRPRGTPHPPPLSARDRSGHNCSLPAECRRRQDGDGMARPADLSVILLDHIQMAVPDGYTGFGFYLVDQDQRIHAGPFRSRETANAYLEDLWHQPRTG